MKFGVNNMNNFMKTCAAVVAASMFLTACTGSARVAGHEYSAYGAASADQNKNPNIEYRVSIFNVVLAVVFVETIVVPIVVLGWQLMVPDHVKGTEDPTKKGLE
jgi:predicted small secreted protein